MKLKFASIAKVCQTDLASVEAIYKEMIAQIHDAIKKSVNLRISFRVGRLVIHNQEISWKQFSDDDNQVKQHLFKEAAASQAVSSRYTRIRQFS